MSSYFSTFSNNSDHGTNSIDNSLQQPNYDNVSDTISDYSNMQYHQASLQHDGHVQQNDFAPTPHNNANAKVSIPKISKRFDSSQNQILKIEFEIVIKLQNDQPQQNTQCICSPILPKNRTVNRLNPYRKPNERNFKNQSNNDAHSFSFVTAPQLNRTSAVYMQNVDNNHTSRSQFQPDDDLNESFRNNRDRY
ncbi:hypothetical protein RclHR1_10300005 [Rhizophagus clarus]|uniref:Uncharacterized protein n=1 Tax=Rhizophagus clarus TaxID=94130 RepID=A0A2Z6QTH4_9GLOM|nr:hypothetical protein RclHR1_10300005 [Rhizophagus clarus]GES74789.1 hypothetical protein GLOIN_2v1770932 [Rhizophagus clarus]